MTSVTLVRHFETKWNRQGRIQGRSDQPLADDVVAEARNRRPVTIGPEPLAWFTSPLRRATETAILLGCSDAAHDSRLSEMDWGRWEGKRLHELRADLGEKMARNEALGLDFRPDGGESPREVSERAKEWLLEVRGRDCAAVTHKGVIRAVLALALDWDMKTKPPVSIDWQCAHVFSISTAGVITLTRANQPLHVETER